VRRNEQLLMPNKICQHRARFWVTHNRASRDMENAVKASTSRLIFTSTVFATLRRVALFVAKIQQGSQVAVGL
jgi:hypothetical protein